MDKTQKIPYNIIYGESRLESRRCSLPKLLSLSDSNMKRHSGPPITGHFVTDVIIYLILTIKHFKDRSFEPSPLIEDESEETQRRWVCQFYLTSLPKLTYGISRSTKNRRLRKLRKAGIIEKVGKGWIPTKGFYSEIVKLLE